MKTIFKVMINRERTGCRCKCDATHYEDVLSLILGFIYWIKEANEQDNDFFRQIRIVSNDWKLEDEEREELKLFTDVLESFIRGRINKDIKYTTLASTIKEDQLIKDLQLLDELKELVLNFELPGSMYSVGYYQAKIKRHEEGDKDE